MELNCLPITNNDITTGFNCISSVETLEHIGTAPNDFYIQNLWTNGEFFISVLLSIFLFFEIFKYAFSVFFPNVIQIIKHKQ
jgi:hypothetical protein